jgi:hypothetical protein
VANNYNTKPIYLDSTMASGWRALQTLNVGTQWGFNVSYVEWQAPVSAGDKFVIVDPASSAVLLEGSCGQANADVPFDLGDTLPAWRDFKVTTLNSGILLIWYR